VAPRPGVKLEIRMFGENNSDSNHRVDPNGA
jgi:hypothetical protein